MKLKAECIGQTYYVKSLDMNVTIFDNPEKFGFYKSLGLDVFEKQRYSFPKKTRAKSNNKGTSERSNADVDREGNAD